MSQPSEAAPNPEAPSWQPISAADRRVVGVLVEKAKTTPEAYPLSINALRAGCNQKSNRAPSMEMEIEDVEEALDRLRALGAIVEVQSGGRVARFRHRMYEWLGVEKVELAVMAELLLRGAQTEGELRGRAGRMEPIADLAALRPILNGLKEKGLVIPLTPEGRGHTITHALYEPRELEKLQAQYGGSADSARPVAGRASASAAASAGTSSDTADSAGSDSAGAAASPTSNVQQLVDSLRRDVTELRDQLAELRRDVASLRARDA